ncbi:MAG: pitrilysin family protein [Proteobacteria bacterium]|nr:pitrilysin family protein [Pseudomonadota bacterium]MDA0992186.1 pitrilysin family protein [Pseudomonadota bacterium]
MLRKFSSLLSVLILVVLSTFAKAADDDLASQVDIPYEMFRLENGLTTLVYSDHSSPTIFVGVWYGVGSKDEPEGKTGFAHLFEHLMFQGTASRDGEYFEPFTKAGATGMNGTTNEDRTNYYATVPTGALDMALWMESDRMSNLLGAVTQDALDEQRSVVQNEKRSGDNRPYSGVYDRVRAGIYPVDHPYRHSVIGSMEDLDNAALEDVHEWFNKYYGASNVVLVLAGDIDLQTAREKVSHYFAEAPTGVPLTEPKQWIPEINENRTEIMYDRVGQTRITRVWPLPNGNNRDTTLMYLVDETLVGNKNSPLQKALVDDLQLATAVRGGAYGRVISGEYSLTINLRPGVAPEQVIAVVDKVLGDYLQSGPDEEILENAKLAINMSMISSMESKSTIGRMLAEGQLYSNDPTYVKKEIAWLNEATAGQILAVANRWLTRGHFELTVLPFPDLKSSDQKVDRSAIPMVTEVSDIHFPDISTAILANGMGLVVANSGSLPLVDVSIRINTGNTADAYSTQGISDAVFALMDKGTKKFDANELATEKDRIAMDARFNSGVESSSMSYQVLSTYLDQSLNLAAEMLRNPTFPEDELEKFRQQVYAYLSNVEKNPTANATPFFNRAIYGNENPLGGVWTHALVDNLNQDSLREFHAREIAPDSMTVFMIGDIDIAIATKLVNDSFGKWKARSNSSRKPVGNAIESAPRIILVNQPEAVQSTIVVGHAIPPFDEENNTELTVLNAVFGGDFEARINMNLREDKGWSYGMGSGISQNTSGDMALTVGGSVQTDKTMESLVEIRKEFVEFVSARPATEDELQRVKLNRIRSQPGRFSTRRGFLQSMIGSSEYGLPYNYAENMAARVDAVTLEGVNTRAKAMMRPSDLTWVIVGDLSKIEEQVRSLNYGEVEVWDAYGNKLR